MADSTPPVDNPNTDVSGITKELEESFAKMIRQQADIAKMKNDMSPHQEATRTFK
jgi:hypothetical protein